MSDTIVDRIYEAAALPELWGEVFDALSSRHGFVGAGMFSSNTQFQRSISSQSIAGAYEQFFAEGWHLRNCRAPRAAQRNHPGFLRDVDILTEEEIATDPMYVEFLRPIGLGYSAGTLVDAPSGDKIVFSFEREAGLGPSSMEVLDELDALRPHLARAAVFSARLDLERSQAQVAALEALGLPAAVLGPDGRALAINAPFEALTAQVRIGAFDAIALSDAAADAVLREALGRPVSLSAAGCSIPLKAVHEAPPAVLHVLPVRRAARDVFSRAAWLLVATPLGKSAAPDVAILAGLFDLTPAEARVARGLIEGASVSEIASRHALAESTIRNQLRGVFSKTGASRQSELVLMCGGIGLPGR